MTDRPALLDAMRRAPGAVFHAAPEDERQAVDVWLRELRAGRKARKEERQERIRRIIAMAFEGLTIPEIGAELGMTPKNVSYVTDKFGLRLGRSTSQRRLIRAPVSAEHVGALDRLAADFGGDRTDVLFTLVRYLLDDDAFIARRQLHLPKRTSSEADVAAE